MKQVRRFVKHSVLSTEALPTVLTAINNIAKLNDVRVPLEPESKVLRLTEQLC